MGKVARLVDVRRSRFDLRSLEKRLVMTLSRIVQISAVQADSRCLTRCREDCFGRRVGVLVVRLLAKLRLSCRTMGEFIGDRRTRL